MARAAGYSKTYTFSEIDAFEDRIDEALSDRGPVFVTLEVEEGVSYPRDYVAIHSAEARSTFREALRAI